MLAVALAAALAVGCSATRRQHSSTGVIPLNAVAVVAVNAQPGSAGEWAALRTALRRVPSFRLVEDDLPEPQRAVDQALVAMGGRVNLDYDRHVKPWLGKTAGVAVWPVDGGVVGWAAWVDARDADKALAAMRRSAGKPSIREYRGERIFEGTAGPRPVWYAVLAQRLVVAPRQSWLRASIDANRSGSVEGSAEWKRLMAPVREGDFVAAAYVSPRLWKAVDEQFDRVLEDAAGEPTEADRERMSWMRTTLKEQQRKTRAASLVVTARADMLGVDLRTIGEEGEGAKGGEVDLRARIDALPDATAFAFASATAATPSAGSVESARATFRSLRRQFDLESAEPGGPDEVRPGSMEAPWASMFELAERCLEECTDAMERGYDGPETAGIVTRGSTIALVGDIDVQDADAARAAVDLPLGMVATWLRANSRLRLTRTNGGDTTTWTLSGIPVGQVVDGLAGGSAAQAAKVRANPLVREFVRPRLQLAVRTTGDEQQFSIPPWGLDLLGQAEDGEGTLAGDRAYLRDLEAADAPRDASVLGWMSLERLGEAVLTPLDASAAFVVNGQLSHVGGPVFWVTRDGSGDDTVTDVAIRFPMYE